MLSFHAHKPKSSSGFIPRSCPQENVFSTTNQTHLVLFKYTNTFRATESLHFSSALVYGNKTAAKCSCLLERCDKLRTNTAYVLKVFSFADSYLRIGNPFTSEKKKQRNKKA